MEPELEARLWAVSSYVGLFFGIPVGIAPLVLRRDHLSLEHGKHSTVVFLQSLLVVVVMFVAVFGLTVVSGVLGFLTCGLANFVTVPLTLAASALGMMALVLPLVSLVHGLVLALQDDASAPIGNFGLSARLFSGIQLEPPTVLDAAEV